MGRMNNVVPRLFDMMLGIAAGKDGGGQYGNDMDRHLAGATSSARGRRSEADIRRHQRRGVEIYLRTAAQ